MVRFYKTASGRRRYNRYRRYRRWYKRKYRRFANGSARSRVRVKIPVQFNVALSVPAGATASNVLTVCPFFNNKTATAGTLAEAALRGGLPSSSLFINYCNLYDSFKVDGMKAAVSITSPVGAGQGAFPSLSVYTAWDRKWQRGDFTQAAEYPTIAKMRVASTFLASTAVNNSITKLKRSCYASDLFEKASFIDCHGSQVSSLVAGVASQNVDMFTTSDQNPPTVSQPAFCPCFMFGVDTGSSIDAVNARPVTLVVEVMYYVTFRNPKFGGSSSSAKIDAIERSIPLDDGGFDDDGDLDDDGGPPAPSAAAEVMDYDQDLPSAREKSVAASAEFKRQHRLKRTETLSRILPPPPKN